MWSLNHRFWSRNHRTLGRRILKPQNQKSRLQYRYHAIQFSRFLIRWRRYLWYCQFGRCRKWRKNRLLVHAQILIRRSWINRTRNPRFTRILHSYRWSRYFHWNRWYQIEKSFRFGLCSPRHLLPYDQKSLRSWMVIRCNQNFHLR